MSHPFFGKSALFSAIAKLQRIGCFFPIGTRLNDAVDFRSITITDFPLLAVKGLTPYLQGTYTVTVNQIDAALHGTAPKHSAAVKRPLCPILRHLLTEEIQHDALTGADFPVFLLLFLSGSLKVTFEEKALTCLLYTSPSPRDS